MREEFIQTNSRGENREHVVSGKENEQKPLTNTFFLQKVSLRAGQRSQVETGWKGKVALMATPRLGESLQWRDDQDFEGNSTAIQRIEKISENTWRIVTATSTYELQHIGDETKANETYKFPIEKILSDSRTPHEVVEALKQKEFQPISSVEVDGQVFYLAPVLRSRSRDTALAYVLDRDGVSRLRIFYRSTSDGCWRLNAPSGSQNLSKGLTHPEFNYRHYTRETKPHELVTTALDALPLATHDHNRAELLYDEHREIRHHYKSEMNFKQYALETGPANEHPLYFSSLINSGVYIDNRVMRGMIYGDETISIESVRNIEYPPGFIPDFSQEPIKVYMQSHAILSGMDQDGKQSQDIRVEVFEGKVPVRNSQFEKVLWHIASAPDGKVWIDRIIPESARINSFGVYDNVYDFGVLDLKPFEYVVQSMQIPSGYKIENKEYRFSEYSDITPFLNELKPIQLYKRYRSAPKK